MALLRSGGAFIAYGIIPLIDPTSCRPAHCTGARKQAIACSPDPAYIFTRFAERQNLTMRMSRRFARLTNGFSKKVENHKATVSLYTMFYNLFYNFGRIHKTLRATPAMEAGKADQV